MNEKKKKGRAHPFVSHLHQDEHIVWIDEAPASKLPIFTRVYFGVTIIILCVCVIAVNQLEGLVYAICTSVGCILFLLAVGVFVTLIDVKDFLRHSYALTNKHIFWWDGDQVTKASLKDIPLIHIMQSNGSQGTLSFGDEFPAMPNIEDAAYVKTMIEQAQKHRLEEDC